MRLRKQEEQGTLTVDFVTIVSGDTRVSLRELTVTGPPEYLGGVLHTLLYAWMRPTEDVEKTDEATDEEDLE